MSKEMRQHIDNFNKFRLSENLNISDVMNSKIMENSDNQKNTKMEKLKELLELVSEVDIMYHEEHKEYFFEWMKDGKFITVWLGDYV
jgi:hypothetical protein